MVHQTIEIIIAAIVFIGIGSLWFAMGHMVYLAYCRNICGQNSSECHLDDKIPAVFFVKTEASESLESHQEDEISVCVSLINDQYSV